VISTSDLSLKFGSRTLFDEVNVKFTPGNCYGLIGANGAGKSTFLKILSGDIDSTSGQVVRDSKMRLSFLKQDQNAYDEETVLNTVLMGNEKLYRIMREKEALYAKPDFSEKDGIKASDLENQFAEMNGYESESEAGILLAGLGIPAENNDKLMKELDGSLKVKILLAQALFGKPEILLLDEPTNHLDIYAIQWLEDFLLNFENTVIVVSHDRYFMNKVCSHIADIDYSKIKTYTGNYEFWRQSCELSRRMQSDQNKKNAAKAEELKSFIARFSANASKSKQATSRQKQLEKLELGDMPVSSRRYPFVGFKPTREAGNDILEVDNLNYKFEGETLLKNISFRVNRGDKIAFLGKNDVSKSALFDIIAGEVKADSGSFNWGVTISTAYFPVDNSQYFNQEDMTLIDWLRQYSTEKDESFIRGFLGKMLFTKEEALKKTKVLSGGEKVRCMLSKMMLSGANVLILDQPTAHLDLESVTALNDGLCRFEGTMLFTSQDHEFVQTIANRVIDLNVTIKNDFNMTYDEYIADQKSKLNLQ
jgi:ATPase subunit of ABC transporter with duplicated ATPase domains